MSILKQWFDDWLSRPILHTAVMFCLGGFLIHRDPSFLMFALLMLTQSEMRSLRKEIAELKGNTNGRD